MEKAVAKRRLVHGLLAGAAVVSLALAPAAGAQPNGNGTGSGGKCKPGQVKTEETKTTIDGVVVATTTTKYVCNKKGQWRKVISITAGGDAFGGELAGDIAQSGGQASQKPNGNGGGKATCKAGGKEGDERTFVVETWLNGKLISSKKVKYRCESDGKWHAVIRPGADDVAQPQSVATEARS
jgi:hypothetical protein